MINLEKKQKTESQMVKKAGFTLVELLIAIGLFSTIVTIGVGGFARALRTQRQATALLAANSNISLSLEQMAREIRTGYDFCVNGSSTDCGAPIPDTSNSFRTLVFNNAQKQMVTYCYAATSGIGRIERGLGNGSGCGNYQAITADNVNIRYLTFVLSGNMPTDSYPPRITILAGVSPRESALSSTTINIQTTVSSRVSDG